MMMFRFPLHSHSVNFLCNFIRPSRRFLSYVQGQYRDKTREYFYFIDHQGMLFMDDSRMKNFTSCFKDKKFLHFFFTRLRLNETGHYESEFPFVSPCGRELNYIRCDDLPIVFTKIHKSEAPQQTQLSWAHVEDLLVPFYPQDIYMSPSGRIYHPTPEGHNYPPGIGLIASKIGIEISQFFTFDSEQNPKTFKWEGKEYELTNRCAKLLDEFRNKR